MLQNARHYLKTKAKSCISDHAHDHLICNSLDGSELPTDSSRNNRILMYREPNPVRCYIIDL